MIKSIKVLKECDIYPGKKNGYMVKSTYDNGTSMEHPMHKTEVEMNQYLQKIKKKLEPEDLRELEAMIVDWGDYHYEKAMDDCAMEMANRVGSEHL